MYDIVIYDELKKYKILITKALDFKNIKKME